MECICERGSLMDTYTNDYQQIEACIVEMERLIRVSKIEDGSWRAVMLFMRAVYSKLYEIAPELN